MAYLTNKAIVVTGAGRALGRAYAHLAAAEGAAVVVNDIDGDVAEVVTDEILAKGGRAVSEVADVSDWSRAEALIDRCVDEFGIIDNEGSPDPEVNAPAVVFLLSDAAA